MSTSFKLSGGAIFATVSLLAAYSASAAINVTFDTVDSNIGAGIYAFDLSGIVPPPPPTFESSFDLFSLSSPLPGGVDNMRDPVVVSSPSGWNVNLPSQNAVQWFFENTSGSADGTFVIQATPNLTGTLDWALQVSGTPQDNGSGTVTIAVPEPMQYGFIGGVATLGLVGFSSWRRFRSRLCVA